MTREEAIRKLQEQKAEYLEEWVDFSGVAEAYDMAIEALSIDPVKHGRWIKQNPMVDTEECSECGYNIPNEDFRTPFCPWCGAIMVEGEKDE